MERRLFIIRHGKSSWDYERLEDPFRPLAERGIRDAGAMATRFRETGRIPEQLFTSDATRALSTALIMSGIWELPAPALQVHQPLYLASSSEIHQVIATASPEVTGLAIFGHNPSFTDFANLFLADPLENLPTAGVVMVTFDCDRWKDIGRSTVQKTFLDYPKRKNG